MSQALQRIDDTRDALISALHQRDWAAIGRLDETCRSCIDEALSEERVDESVLREKLESLLLVYQELLQVTTIERQAVVNEMSQISQAKNASKVYHLFG